MVGAAGAIMTCLILTLEAIPGTPIFVACHEACRIAKQLDVNVKIKFNDKMILAKPSSQPELLEQSYYSPAKRQK